MYNGSKNPSKIALSGCTVKSRLQPLLLLLAENLRFSQVCWSVPSVCLSVCLSVCMLANPLCYDNSKNPAPIILKLSPEIALMSRNKPIVFGGSRSKVKVTRGQFPFFLAVFISKSICTIDLIFAPKLRLMRTNLTHKVISAHLPHNQGHRP